MKLRKDKNKIKIEIRFDLAKDKITWNSDPKNCKTEIIRKILQSILNHLEKNKKKKNKGYIC